jgi:hypothetical protein
MPIERNSGRWIKAVEFNAIIAPESNKNKHLPIDMRHEFVKTKRKDNVCVQQVANHTEER